MSSTITALTSGGGLAMAGDTSGQLELKTNNGTTAVTVDTSQNVGIGTTTPQNRLELKSTTGTVVARLSCASGSGREYGIASNTTGEFGVYDYTGSAYRMLITSNGNLQFNSGYGSVATAYGCRAWVSFNGTGTLAIKGSGNVSSVTDRGVGDYQVNFTTAMPDLLFATTTNFHPNASNAGSDSFALNPISTSYAEIYHYEAGILRDSVYACAFTFR